MGIRSSSYTVQNNKRPGNFAEEAHETLFISELFAVGAKDEGSVDRRIGITSACSSIQDYVFLIAIVSCSMARILPSKCAVWQSLFLQCNDKTRERADETGERHNDRCEELDPSDPNFEAARFLFVDLSAEISSTFDTENFADAGLFPHALFLDWR